MSIIRPRFHWKDRFPGDKFSDCTKEDSRPLPPGLQIGDRINCHLGKLQKADTHHARPVLVYGIYRAKNQIVALDVMPFNSDVKNKKIYAHEFFFAASQGNKNFPIDRDVRLQARDVFTVPNNRSFFSQDARIYGRLPEQLWPDVLARRADAIIYAPEPRHLTAIEVDRPHVVREGFVFSDLSLDSIKSGKDAPEMHDKMFERQHPVINISGQSLTEQHIDAIVLWANSYVLKMNRLHKNNATAWEFPPSWEWDLGLKREEFPIWPREPENGPSHIIAP